MADADNNKDNLPAIVPSGLSEEEKKSAKATDLDSELVSAINIEQKQGLGSSGDQHLSITSHVHPPRQLTPLEQAINHIVSTCEDSDEISEIIEELADYITDRPDREVIGLEAKLVQGDRAELYSNAYYLKNKFERKLAKHQVSLVAQKVYVHVLSCISTTFDQKVRPLILQGKTSAEIDAVIHSEIIQPVYEAIIKFDDLATSQEVAGMLYFLTGKCHLVWSK